MLSASFEFRNKIAENSKTLFKATLTLADGTVRNLVGDDVMMGSPAFSDAVSSDGSFDVGAAVIGQFTVELNNCDGRFDDYDFTDATIVPYIGVELSDGGVEWVLKGHYNVEQPESYGATIGITALDNMSKFEVPYSEVATVYPASLRTIVMDVCQKCGVQLLNPDFANRTFSVPARPDDSSLTSLAVLSYAAQAAGCFARCDVNGRLVIGWYNTDVFEKETWLDGDRFDDASPYASGDTADGGNFTNYGSGDTVEGGEFGWNTFAHLYAISNMTISTDDVVITGVSVTAQDNPDAEDGEDASGETATFGAQGYVLAIGGNPLIQYGKAATVASQIGERVVGMRFRPFDMSAIGDPLAEPGDPVIITDANQNQYRSYITSLVYKVGNYETFACNAETPSRNSAAMYSALTEAIVQNRKAISKEVSARELAMRELAKELSESSGLFMTEDPQEDGSIIYYMHDKPTLAESQVVWKLTANAFGISTDGGKAYPYGLDVNGDAILNRIYAIGLDADYITTGALVVKNSSGATIFSADKDTKQVYIAGDCVTVESESLTTAIKGIRALYGTCTTAASTAAKVVSCSGFQLRAGAVVNVKFTYKNTAANPTLDVNGTGAKAIYLNNTAITSDYYWNAQDVITFVYSGSYWYVADAGTLAKIKTTADSITLSVSQTYATKSELKVGLDSISLSVTDASLGNSASIVLSVNGEKQTKTIDLSGVRNAFKNDNTSITITAGTVTFNSNTFSVNSTNFSVDSTGVITATSGTIGGFTIGSTSIYNSKMTLDSDGLSLRNGTYNVGDIGTSQDVDDSTRKSLNFHLNGQGAMMTWAARTGTSGTYTRKLTYANKTFGSYKAGRLYVECDAEFWGNTYFNDQIAYNLYIDPNTGGANGGVTGTYNYVASITTPSFSLTNNSGIVFYKNGVFSTGSLGYSLTINHTTGSFGVKKGFVTS